MCRKKCKQKRTENCAAGVSKCPDAHLHFLFMVLQVQRYGNFIKQNFSDKFKLTVAKKYMQVYFSSTLLVACDAHAFGDGIYYRQGKKNQFNREPKQADRV